MMSGSFAYLDLRRAEALAADPMQPGMWRADDKMGRYTGDCFDVLDRAAAKYGGAANVGDQERYQRALQIQREGGRK